MGHGAGRSSSEREWLDPLYGRVHGVIHLDGGGERGAGQCLTACSAVQRAETGVTVRLQRTHAEFPGQGEGVLIVAGRKGVRHLP
jgi:hypothetical protein